MEEIWKDVKGYEGSYQISNYGNIISIKHGRIHILKQRIHHKKRYLFVNLCLNGILKTFQVHQLVSIAFLNHIPNKNILVINHIDSNRSNNNVLNLEIITNRENCSKHKRINFICSSKYTGVHWNKISNKWDSSICINSKRHFLGAFDNEFNAHKAYLEKLQTI